MKESRKLLINIKKGTCLLLLFSIVYFSSIAQAPESFSYQAAVRNDQGNPIANQSARFRVGIWQTDPSTGVRVYQETHDHTTDQFGLAHLSIGTGSVIHGVFANIDWGDGPYFITMELDPAGGSSYQVMGSSQLLSVPYALYAKTAGNVDGSETIITAGTLINVAGTGTIADPYVISSTVDGSETKIIAGDNVTVTGSGTTGSPYQVSASMVEADPDFDASPAKGISSANINNWNDKQDALVAGSGINITGNTISLSGGSTGEFYLGQDTLGGIVFHIYFDEDGNQRGLIVSKTQYGTTRYQSEATLLGADRFEDGVYNYDLMTNSPAKDWVIANFTEEWYIPSIYELLILFTNRYYVNKAARESGNPLIVIENAYWSSTEDGISNAYRISGGSLQIISISKSNLSRVRAIKSF